MPSLRADSANESKRVALVDVESVGARLERLDELLRDLDDIRTGGHDAYMTETSGPRE